MNAQLGKDEKNSFCLYNLSNRNREHLTEFSFENRLILNFRKGSKNYGPTPMQIMLKALIDYILINKKWINSALNCEAYSSFEGVSSDHRIVTVKICLRLCRNTRHRTKITHFDRSLLNNRDISNKYTITLRNKFDALQEIFKTLTLNDEYENFVNAHMKAAGIPIKQSVKHRVPWETLAVRKNEKT